MKNKEVQYGIEGQKAAELSDEIYWVDGDGNEKQAIKLSDYNGKFRVLYGFQSWCPGCHSQGLPSLQEMVKALDGNDNVKFFAIQRKECWKFRNSIICTFLLDMILGTKTPVMSPVLCITTAPVEPRGLFS